MRVVCPQCAQPLATVAINLQRMIGKCDACDVLFDCSDQLPTAQTELPVNRQRRRAPVPLPDGISVDAPDQLGMGPARDSYRSEPMLRGKLTIRRVWRATAKGMGFRAVFSVFWWGFLVVWYSIALTMANWLMILFPLLHVAVGVYFVYSLLADIFNVTEITADGERLSIHSRPISVRPPQLLPVAALTQIYCKERVHKTKKGTSSSYSVAATLQGGRQVVLLEHLPDVDQALFIEQQLESHLGIIDAPVGGELSS